MQAQMLSLGPPLPSVQQLEAQDHKQAPSAGGNSARQHLTMAELEKMAQWAQATFRLVSEEEAAQQVTPSPLLPLHR